MSNAPQPSTLAAALAAHDAGLCVVRAMTDGTKRPYGKWKQYQSERPTREQVEEWFSNGYPGLGVICGAVSGDLEMFELEGRFVNEGGTRAFAAAMNEAGLELLTKRLVNGYYSISPSDGRHIIYRCDGAIDGNTKLARRPSTPDELAEKPDDPIKTLIETRGEGGFVVLAPSHGTVHPTGKPWRVKAGTFAGIPTITVEERKGLFAVARGFDTAPVVPPQLVEPQRKHTPTAWTSGTIGESWVDAVVGHLAVTNTLQTLLERYGWVYCYTDGHGRALLRRPGRADGVSASVNEHGRLHVFSTSTPFEPGPTTHDHLDVIAAYEHRGDRMDAARHIAESTGIRSAWRASRPSNIVVNEPPPDVDPGTGEITRPATLPEELWGARPVLAQIRCAARNRLVSPSAVLGAVLARVAAFTPPSSCLPAIIGGTVPLSIYIGLRGASGSGKSSPIQAAADLLPCTPAGCVGPFALGSGEGLVEAYFELVEEKGDDGKTRRIKRQIHHGALFTLDEGQALAEIGSRKGSTILPTLRTAWSGGDPGQANASIETRRSLRSGSYSVGLISLWQDRAGIRLIADADGGTPQRFIWLPTDDPDASLDNPRWPGPIEWIPPAMISDGGLVMPNELEVHPDIRLEVAESRIAQLRGNVRIDPLDAHRKLNKLKLGGILGVLDARADISLDDWRIAELIMTTSDEVRRQFITAARLEADSADMAGAERSARREGVLEDAAHERAVRRAARAVANKIHREESPVSRRDLQSAVAGRDRKVIDIDEAIDFALDREWIQGIGDSWKPGTARPS